MVTCLVSVVFLPQASVTETEIIQGVAVATVGGVNTLEKANGNAPFTEFGFGAANEPPQFDDQVTVNGPDPAGAVTMEPISVIGVPVAMVEGIAAKFIVLSLSLNTKNE